MTAKATKPALAFFEPLVVKTASRSQLRKRAFLFDFWILVPACESGSDQSLDLIDRLPGRLTNAG